MTNTSFLVAQPERQSRRVGRREELALAEEQHYSK